MVDQLVLFLKDEKATLNFGASLTTLVPDDFVIYLCGELGAGKTTIVRGFLRGLGYQYAIKSPTYTLVESYQIQGKLIHHFDLYRVIDSEELELIGVRDYFLETAICFIEWPENARDVLHPPDLSCEMTIRASGRNMVLKFYTERALELLEPLEAYR